MFKFGTLCVQLGKESYFILVLQCRVYCWQTCQVWKNSQKYTLFRGIT